MAMARRGPDRSFEAIGHIMAAGIPQGCHRPRCRQTANARAANEEQRRVLVDPGAPQLGVEGHCKILVRLLLTERLPLDEEWLLAEFRQIGNSDVCPFGPSSDVDQLCGRIPLQMLPDTANVEIPTGVFSTTINKRSPASARTVPSQTRCRVETLPLASAVLAHPPRMNRQAYKTAPPPEHFVTSRRT